MSPINFKPLSHKISNFSILSSFDNVNETSSIYFICATKRPRSNSDATRIYKSRKISYDGILSGYVNYMNYMTNDDKSSLFNPIGAWMSNRKILISNNFNNNNSNKYENILTDDFLKTNKYKALNYNFCEKYFIGELTKLSSNYFGKEDSSGNWKQRLPSYVGMVVINDKFNDLSDVTAIYDGMWKKWEGRFILGAGSIDESNTTDVFGSTRSGDLSESVKNCGGANKVSITSEQIPQHTHKFRAGSSGIEPKFGKFPEYHHLSNNIKIGTDDFFDVNFPAIIETDNEFKVLYDADLDKLSEFDGGFGNLIIKNYNEYGKTPLTRNLDLQTYGSNSETVELGRFMPEITNVDTKIYKVKADKKDELEVVNVGDAHNNLHTYYVTNIWERTA